VDDHTEDRLDWEVPADGTYVLVVEGWSEHANGDYDLLVASTGSEVCTDGVDNDLNGLVDCLDPTCDQTAACPFECPAEAVVPPAPPDAARSACSTWRSAWGRPCASRS